MRILIAEDDEAARWSMGQMVQEYGECEKVTDGEKAVEAFRMAWHENRPYDLILMDIMMPRMDGQAALERIREIERSQGIADVEEVKAIMVTALEDPKSVVQAFYQGGASSYLVKPIEKEKLQEELGKLGFFPENSRELK